MAVLSIGQVWADDPTISWDFKTLQTTSGTQSGITWETGKTGSATATACNSTNGLVLYGVSSGGGYFQTTSAINGTITNVNIVSANKKNTPKYTVYCSTDGSTWDEIAAAQTAGTKDHAVTGSYTYVKVANTTAATAQLGVASITVTYTPSGGGTKTLTGVTISGNPTKTSYYAGQDFDPAGLTVTGTYSDETTGPITSSITWAYNPAQTLELNQTSIGVTATVGEIASPEFTVNNLSVTAAPVVVSSIEDIEDGASYYIRGVRSSGSMIEYLKFTDGTAGATIAGGSASTTDEAIAITFNKVSDGVYQLVTPEGLYVQPGASNGKIALSTSATTCNLANTTKTWDNSAAIAISTVDGSSNTWIIQKNTSGTNFGGYKNSGYDVTLVFAGSAPIVATPTISGTESFLAFTTVTLGCATDGATIYYTTDNSDPKTSGTKQTYSAPFDLTATTTVRAIAELSGDWSNEAPSKTFTKATVLTVAEAIAAIPNKDDVVNNQYVEGIVCTAGTSVNASGQMTYYISADGTEATRLQIYLGKNLNNTDFTAVSDLAIGDRVTVFGQLKNFNNTPEMNSGNYLVSKAAPAVAAPTFSPDGGGFMGETDVTITCATAGNIIYYTLDGTTPSKSSNVYSEPIHLNATTTITAVAYVGDDASLVIAKTFTLTAPMTVAEALAALDSEDPINNVAVAGIISTAPTANPSSGKLTYYISDDGSDTDELEVYLGYGLNGASFSAKTDLQVGDEVTVFGNLTIFNSTTKEFASGSRLLAFNRPEAAVTGIDLTESTAEVEVGKTVTLHASVVPANATNKTIVWSVQSGSDYASVENGVVTGIAAGEAVIRAASDENASIYEECTVTVTEPAPLSPWASVYTSNVELSGSQNVKVTITVDEEDKNFDGVKMNKAAAATFTIPAGTTNLYAHMAAWNGEAQTVTVSGDCFDADKSIDIVADANISGSGTTYDIDDAKAPTDYFKEIVLDKEVTEPTEITITAASGKRFVLFGVNQVGGLVLESIAISGTATELEYNEGDHFDPAGLKVMGHYSDNSDAEITEGIDWAFDPDPLTQGTTSVSVTATVDAISSPAFVVNELTVSGAAPLSPWATVYTSNVELSGSQNVKVTITVDEEDKNFDGVKMNKAAAATFTIPAGTTNLYAHMAAWNGEAQTVTVSGDCFDADKSIDIVADANISGSGTTYDIDDAKAPTDYFKEIVLDKEVTEPTEITITAASGKRFVLFGVNQEGGVLPVLKSIEISGDLTNKSGYKVGDDLDLDGLTVSAIYTLNEVDQAPIDVTSLVNWSYDPLVEGQTSVTITATLEDKSDDITISDLEAVASADPKIYVSTLNVDFGSVEVGEAVPANETVTVTLTNVAAATATLDGEGFSISPSTLTASGDITVSVVASTASAANYSATLTISDDATENPADSKVITLSFAVTEPVVNEEYELVSDVNTLAAGDQIIIVAENAGTYYTLDGSITSQYFPSTAVSISAGIITAPSTSAIILGKDEDNWTMSMGGQLIGATAAKKASLGNTTTATNTWTIAIAENVATITNTTTTYGSLQFNYNGGSNSRFLNYTSAQTAVAIYKKVAPEPPTPVYETVRAGLTPNHYYTICYPKAMTDIQGATLWSFVGKDANFAYIEQETATTIAAGKPYIMYATASTVQAVLTGDNAAAGENGALHGTYMLMDQSALNAAGDNIYLVIDNQLRRVDGQTGNSLPANRAYVDLDQISDGTPTPAPGKKVRKMPMQGQTTTGCELINAAEAPAKMMINGQLFILRGEKKYDATGRLVK